MTLQDQINAVVSVQQQLVPLQTGVSAILANAGLSGALVDAINLNLQQALNKSMALLKTLLP